MADMNNTSLFLDTGNVSLYPDMPVISRPGWGLWINLVTTPIIVFVGIVGNSLSLIVMKSKTLRHKSYSHYLCALAVFDTINLVIRLVTVIDEYYMEILAQPGLFHNFSDVSCKMYKYTEHVAYLMSSWLVVIMAIERLSAVWFPFRKLIIRKQSGAAAAIFCLLVLVGLSQVFRIIMIEYVTDSQTCAAADQYIEIFTSLDIYFYQWTLTFFLPVITVLICNSLVVYQIIRVGGEVKVTCGDEDFRYNRAVRKKHHTTRMLLTVSSVFILTLIPLLLLNLTLDISIRRQSGHVAWATYVGMYPYLQVAAAFSLINYAVNFFIYVLSGRRFRYELRKIFQKDHSTTRRSFIARSTREEFIQL